MVWTKHLCRICAQIGDACYPIFDTTSGRNIEMKMKRCFSFMVVTNSIYKIITSPNLQKLQVFKDDYKPKEICNCCYMKLNELFEFIEMCYASNGKFETMVFSSNQGLWLEKQTQSYENCHINGVIVNTKSNIENDLTSNVVMVVNYENSVNLNQSINDQLCINTIDIKDVETVKGIKKTNASFRTYECCEQNQTVLRHSSDFYRSLQGSDVHNFVNVENNDMNRYDIDKGKNVCNITNITNDLLQSSNDEKDSSKTIITTKKTYACEHCNKTFMRKNSLNMHLSIHTNTRPCTCEICNKSFANKKFLKSHKKIHNTKHKCKYCSKGFSVPSKLERHLRIHTNTKPFVCPVENCRKSFSDKCNLTGHKLTHSNQKNFACDICKKSYKFNSQLKDHKKAHSNNKPFKCRICGKTYKWKTNLTVHIKKHEGYKCIRCNKDCGKLSKLFKHRKFCKENYTKKL